MLKYYLVPLIAAPLRILSYIRKYKGKLASVQDVICHKSQQTKMAREISEMRQQKGYMYANRNNVIQGA